MYKILIWGTGVGYNKSISIIKKLEEVNDITVIGVTSNDDYYSYIDDIAFVPKKVISSLDFDYILVTAIKAYEKIVREGVGYGIKPDVFLPMDILFIENFSFNKYIKLHEQGISIISNNCWGGVTYHYLHLKFMSPFINMYIENDDYLRMLHDFKDYMSENIFLCGMEYNEVEQFEYPVFCLGDVKLHMNHYRDIEDAEFSWYKRRDRINYDNLFVMMYTQKVTDAREFEDLNFSRKVCFTNFEHPEFSSTMVVRPSLRGKKEFWEYVIAMANGSLNYYDVWSLLIDGTFRYRVR